MAKVTKLLKKILAGAYKPCPSMKKCRQNGIRYNPKCGLIPRGYTGATGNLNDIELILCLAEPGEPSKGEKYTGTGFRLIDNISSRVAKAYRERHKDFHNNVRIVLNYCWPEFKDALDEQLKRTWITEGILCSAKKTTGNVPRVVEKECANCFLRQQLELLPHAFVVALGKKAQRRLEFAGRPADVVVRAAGMPIHDRKKAEAGWRAAGCAFRAWRNRKAM
jgi:hypothetical protein